MARSTIKETANGNASTTSLASRFCSTAAVTILLLSAFGTHGTGFAQTLENRIGSFRAVDVSSEKLSVSVDYTYVGDSGQTDVSINATPEESGGVFDPRLVDFEELPLEPGTHSATMTITKRTEAVNFTTVSIRVCMSARQRAILCEDFAHVKTWTTAVAPTSPEPAPPPKTGTCSISGEVSGRLIWRITDDRGEPVTFTLRDVLIMAPGWSHPQRARLHNRRYTFNNLSADVSYRIFPSNFRADPRERRVACVTNIRHRGRDFRITGPPPQG